MSMGPDRPLYLHLASLKIEEVDIRAQVDKELKPSLELDIQFAGKSTGNTTVEISLRNLQGNDVKREVKDVQGKTGKDVIRWDLANKVDLWWPIREGPQTLYDLEVILRDVVSLIGFLRMASNQDLVYL